MKHTSGGASISVLIKPTSDSIAPNPSVGLNLMAFLTMMEKADIYQRGDDFTKCLTAFLEEVDIHLDDGLMSRSPESLERDSIEKALDAYMQRYLDPETKEGLRKLKKRETE